MRIVDANVLLYAVNRDAVHHDASWRWLDGALQGGDSVGFAWIVLLAFLRISTKEGLFPEPLTPAEAAEQVDAWVGSRSAEVVHPGSGHVKLLERFVSDAGTGGDLISDAHLAALALERRAEIVSYDNDFDRFPGVRRRRPDDLLMSSI